MTKSFKILSTISFIAMAIVLTFVGVWAIADLDLTVGGDITYTAPKLPAYITMGSYGGQEVKWRLIGVDGERFEGGNIPASGMGTFILETDLGIFLYFDEWGNDDYYSSEIRTYLTSTFVSALSLSNNEIYQKISARSITDLYKSLSWKWGLDGIIEDVQVTGNANDKLWLLSVVEIYTLLGGGIMLDNKIEGSNNWSKTIKNNIAWNENRYWLRSTEYGGYAFIVDSQEVDTEFMMCYSSNVDMNEHSLRPAFNIDLSKL